MDRFPSDVKMDPSDADWQVRAGLQNMTVTPPKPSGSMALLYDQPGEPKDVLRFVPEEVPPVGPGELEVRFLKTPINPSDINIVQGRYPVGPKLPNGCPGQEAVGVITKVGAGVTGFQLGDWVVPIAPAVGTWRQVGVFEAHYFYRMNANEIPEDEACTLGVNPPTALALLKNYVDLKPGDVVIQNGANSAVGQNVIQICRAYGVHTINIIRDRTDFDSVAAQLKSLGATVVTTEVKLRGALMAAKLPEPVLGLNCIGGSAALAVAKTLKEGGTLVTYGGMSGQPLTLPTSLFIFKDLHFYGFWLSKGWDQPTAQAIRKKLLDECVSLIKQGKLSTECKTFPFDQWRHALEVANQPVRGAKVLLQL